MKRFMLLRLINGETTGKSRMEKSGKRAACAVWVLCASLFFMACAREETAAEQAGQSEDWLTERAKQDRRTSQDRRTQPQDSEKVKSLAFRQLGRAGRDRRGGG